MKTMKRIYFDNAATTPIKPEVLDAMMPFLTEYYGNPSSIYQSEGAYAAKALIAAREKMAAAIGAEPSEIYFTSGGSESDNFAIKGAAEKLREKGRHIITSAIEHHAVLHAFEHLERLGFEATYLPVDSYGLVYPEDLKKAIRPDTILISIMMANNEIGTIEPIKELAEIAKQSGILFHTDAVQAFGQIPIDVKALGADMLSVSGHKLHAPKGVGALYIKKGLILPNLIDGGMQEKGRRAGTENVASIVGFAKAAEIATVNLEEKAAKLTKIRDKIISETLKIPHVRLNGHPEKRLPGNANFSIEYIEGESILLSLDVAGIATSSGSACTSGSLDPSHVLLAIGLPHEIAHGSLRVTLSDLNTAEEADRFIETLPAIVENLRAMSPIFGG